MKMHLFFLSCLLSSSLTHAQDVAQANNLLPNCADNGASANHQLPPEDRAQIEAVIQLFMRGGDESDTTLLSKVLSPQFRVVVNQGVLGLENLMVLDRVAYFKQIVAKKWGGLPRTVQIVSISIANSIATAEVKTSSVRSDITSFLHFVKGKDGNWTIINDTPYPVPKSKH